MTSKRRVAMLVENVKDSGGNRVIFLKAKELAEAGNKLTIYVTARKIRTLKDVAGQTRDIIASKLKYRFADAVTLLRGKVDFSEFDEVITTGRRALDFITNLGDLRHLHLIQHVETWKTFNSDLFRQFSEQAHYASGPESLDLIRRHGLPDELAYLDRVAQIRRFTTVSSYLGHIVESFGSGNEITVREPPDISAIAPKTTPAWESRERDIDVLYFLRGLPFKGDALTLKVIEAMNHQPYKAVVIANLRGEKLLQSAVGHFNLAGAYNWPSDEVVADIYSRAKIIVHPSLTEGFGAIPREALQFGSHLVASRVGWLQDVTQPRPNLTLVDRHDPALYISEIKRLLRL